MYTCVCNIYIYFSNKFYKLIFQKNNFKLISKKKHKFISFNKINYLDIYKIYILFAIILISSSMLCDKTAKTERGYLMKHSIY